jgi:hypothetical protein
MVARGIGGTNEQIDGEADMSKFVVKGNLGGEGQIKPEMFDTEEEALERAAQLIDEYGPRILTDVWLDGQEGGGPFRDFLWVQNWRDAKRQTSN